MGASVGLIFIIAAHSQYSDMSRCEIFHRFFIIMIIRNMAKKRVCLIFSRVKEKGLSTKRTDNPNTDAVEIRFLPLRND